jgi:hypothetical protein
MGRLLENPGLLEDALVECLPQSSQSVLRISDWGMAIVVRRK